MKSRSSSVRLVGGLEIEAIHAADEAEVLRRGEAAEECEAFGDYADLALDVEGVRGEVQAEEFDVAGGGSQETSEHFDGGGFACAVGSEEAEKLACGDVESDAVNRGERAKAAGEVAEGNGGRIHWRFQVTGYRSQVTGGWERGEFRV
jgi:hypothetical protein